MKSDAEMRDELLSTPLDKFDWSVRILGCFRNEDVETIGNLCDRSESELRRWPNFGKKSLQEVREFLHRNNLNLRRQERPAPPGPRELTPLDRRILEPGTLSLCLRTVSDHVKAACAIHRISHFNRNHASDHHIAVVEARMAHIDYVVRSWASEHGGIVE